MERFINKKKYFKTNAVFNWVPGQLLKGRGDVLPGEENSYS